MSLLLDARKKVELALQHSDAHTAGATQAARELGMDDLPQKAPQKNPDEPSHAAQRAAGQNLFAAKAAHNGGMRLGIIPIALISGLVLAAGGSYYVWREISPPPMQRRIPPPAAPQAITAPPAAPQVAQPAAPMAQAAHAPVIYATATTSATPAKIVPAETKPAKAVASRKKTSRRADAPSTPAAPDVSSASSTPAAPDAPPAPAAKSDTAAQSIQIEHAQDGDAVDPILLAAYQAYRSGNFDTARQRYHEVLRKNAQNRDALLGMAAIAQQQSQDAIAASYFNQVLMLDPRDPVANAGMAALVGTIDTAATESRLKLLLAQQPRPVGAQSSALYFALGNLYAEQSRWGDAQQAYFNAYNLEPDNAQLAFNLAVSLDHLGQGKLAAQHYQRALQLDISYNPGFNRAQTQQRINELTAP